MKLKGLTLLELLVGLAISAIVLGIVLTGLNWLGTSFRTFSLNSEREVEQLNWLNTLQGEFASAELIQSLPDKLVIHERNRQVTYRLDPEMMIRIDHDGNRDSLMVSRPIWKEINEGLRIRYVLTGEVEEQTLLWEFLYFERIRF